MMCVESQTQIPLLVAEKRAVPYATQSIGVLQEWVVLIFFPFAVECFCGCTSDAVIGAFIELADKSYGNIHRV